MIKITNVYSDHVLTGSGCKGAFGNAFHLNINGTSFLYDTGLNGKVTLSNMQQLGIDPNLLESIILSHGHFDHTFGLLELLKVINRDKITIVAHPQILEKKSVSWQLRPLLAIGFGKSEIGFPTLPANLAAKIDFSWQKASYQIHDQLFTLGEIIYRSEKDATRFMTKYHNGYWEVDPVHDDLSLVLHWKSGIILVCGCCHAGLLNACEQARRLWPRQKITHIIGGTHLCSFTRLELIHVANLLTTKYDGPQLYLNHCSGTKSTKILAELLGEEKVSTFPAGSFLEL